jgi:signal transduction histidine kinase
MLTGGWWQHRSLRAKVTLGAALVITAGVVVLAAGVLLGIRYLEISVLDSAAVERANSVARLARKGELSNPIPSVGESHVQVLDARGHPLASTTDLDRNVAVVPIPLPDALRTGRPVTRGGLPDGDGATHRVVARQAVFGGQPVTIVVAVSLVHEQRSLMNIGTGLAAGLPVLVALVAVTTWVLTGYTLRPVETLRQEVDDINATDLQRRVAVPVSRDEIHDLASTLNNTLGRLESASTAQRRFVADAAHELRSPLTAIMAETETLVLAADPDAWEQRGPVLLDGLRRLHGLMEDLLALAGLDDPGHRSARRTVDLDDVVFAEMSEVRATTDRTIDVSGVSAAQVLADPRAMARVVRNLLDNAVRHARSEVAVTLHEDDRAVVLAVADDGTGVPADQRERIFDRFVRLDAARGRDSGGSGLGLAIVRDLVDAHDGHVWISDAPSGADAARYPGAWVHVRLPAELR